MILPDARALPAELETFLPAGELLVYVTFGSMHALRDPSLVMIHAARALGLHPGRDRNRPTQVVTAHGRL